MQQTQRAWDIPTGTCSLLFPARRSPLGSLKRVNPNFYDFDLWFSMGGEVTDTQTPFGSRIHVRITKFTTNRFDDSIASFALFTYRQERSIYKFCRITRLHIANSWKNINFFLNQKKIFPTIVKAKGVLSPFTQKIAFIKAIIPSVNILSQLLFIKSQEIVWRIIHAHLCLERKK